MPSPTSQARMVFSNMPIHRKGLVVIAMPIIALVVSTCLFWYAQRGDEAAERAVAHTLEVKERIYKVVRAAMDAQSSVRDFIASGDEQWLVPYRSSRGKLPELFNNLDTLVGDNAGQSARAKRIRSLTDRMLPQVDIILAVLREKKISASDYLQRQKRSNPVVKEWRHELELMLAEEERLLGTRIAHRNSAKQIFNGAVGLSLFLGIVGSVLAARLFTSGITNRIKVLQTNAARLEQGLTLLPFGKQSDEIGRLGAALDSAGHLLAERSERLKLALGAGKISIWEMNTESGRIRYEGENEFIVSTQYPIAALPVTRTAFFELIDIQDREKAEQQFAEALASDGEFRGEYRIGGTGATVRWMAVRARPYSAGGQVGSRVLGVLIDITERKQVEEVTSRQARELAKSEQALREQTRILQCILDSMGDGVVVADTAGNFLLFNPAAEKILGIGVVKTTPDEWTRQYGVFLPDKITPYPASELPLARAIRGISVDGVEMFVRNAKLTEGSWVSATARPLVDEAGVPWGGVAVIGDITQRKDAEQKLHLTKEEAENANRAKSEFLSRMSHELRTPLNAIIGFAQVLEMTEESEHNRTRLGHVLKAGRHLLGLIEEVLDISRIEARRLSLSVEPVLVSEAVQQAVDLVRPIAANAGVRLESSVSAISALYVSADRQRTQQILLNLLSNAIKYNSPGGLVALSCEMISDKIRINVVDTGIGIGDDYLGKLFQPFERLGAVQTAVEGTGLGLALSKGLAEAMGGALGVKSVVGRGSTFWLELSLAESPLKMLERAVAPMAGNLKQAETNCTVLYIEDNLSNVRLMEDILAMREKLKLVTAMQGQLGLDLAREHLPSLIFLDLHLPDLPGHQVLRRLRSDPRTRAIPVVVISADTTPGQVKRLLDGGAQDYLTKPIDVKKLFTVLDEYLSKQGEERVLRS